MSQASTAFQEEQFQEAYPDGVENHYWNLGRNLILSNFLGNTKKKILDIGAGRGIVVQYLRAKGYDAWGSELSPAKLISPELKSHVFSSQNAFQIAESFRKGIEIILLLDVLEHLENPAAFLSECESNFPNLKTILITVPARQELWSNYDEKYGHFRRYDLESCRQLGKNNWNVASCSYFFHLLYPLARILLLLASKRETTIKAPQSKSQIFLHKILGTYFSWESRLLPKNLPGTSVLLHLVKY